MLSLILYLDHWKLASYITTRFLTLRISARIGLSQSDRPLVDRRKASLRLVMPQ